MKDIKAEKTICSMCGRIYEARLLTCPHCQFNNHIKKVTFPNITTLNSFNPETIKKKIRRRDKR
jgi:uncharacterized OB-fold protein